MFAEIEAIIVFLLAVVAFWGLAENWLKERKLRNPRSDDADVWYGFIQVATIISLVIYLLSLFIDFSVG
jgi:hypothetical protein